MFSEIISLRASQTKKKGRELALAIIKGGGKTPRVIGLIGELGGGKTTFLQGFAKGLGIKDKILSPTFLILKKFTLKKRGFKFFYHIDCYRIKRKKEILRLGFKEKILSPKNIIAIEWADRIKELLPPDVVLVNFRMYNKDKRKITIQWKQKEKN